jgi:hypothetical protein
MRQSHLDSRSQLPASKNSGTVPEFFSTHDGREVPPSGSRRASMLLAAGVQASAGHPFAQATFYQEGFF